MLNFNTLKSLYYWLDFFLLQMTRYALCHIRVLPTCPFIAPQSFQSIGGFRCNEWAVVTKGKPKTWHFPFNPINFATFPSWYCPPPPQWNNHNKYGINRKVNKRAFQRYQTWWIIIQHKRNIIDQSHVALLFWRVYIKLCWVKVSVLKETKP